MKKMNKFIVGDLIHIPQGTCMYTDSGIDFVQKPTIGTYLGKKDDELYYKVDVFGNINWISENEIEQLNFVRKDVH